MEDSLFTLAQLNFSEAQILKNMLEANNIDCFLANSNAIRASYPEGIKVRIKESDVENAAEIYSAFKESTKKNDSGVFKDVTRILFPTVFTERAENACEYALGLANALQAEIYFAHVFHEPLISSLAFTETEPLYLNLDYNFSELEEQATKKMEAFIKKVDEIIAKSNYKITYKYGVKRGLPEDTIVDFAEEYKADALVLGTKGHGKKSNDFIGSITNYIIENSKVPVLAIPEDAKFQGINKINVLYASNFDEKDFVSIRKLISLIYLFDIKIYCVHIEEGNVRPAVKVRMREIETHFNTQYAGFNVECCIIDNKNILDGLQEFIKEKYIDIISLTTHKRNIITKLFNPSFTQKILFHTNVPILVFHS